MTSTVCLTQDTSRTDISYYNIYKYNIQNRSIYYYRYVSTYTYYLGISMILYLARKLLTYFIVNCQTRCVIIFKTLGANTEILLSPY